VPSLAEFLKGTVNDSLTKVLQPAGLIPGALLVLLNLGFILPRARDEGFSVAEAYDDLSEGWQIVVVAALILIAGYLLLSASGAVLDTLSGRTWRTSLLASLLSRLRGERRHRLQARAERIDDQTAKDIERVDNLRWRLRTRYAPGPPAATSLGDVLLASEHGIKQRHGVGTAALWEPLRAVLKSDDPAVVAAAEAKSTLDLMGNLTFASALFVFEAVVVFTLFGDPDAVLLALIGLPFVYVAYRVTVTKALSWCDAVDTVVALHATELFDGLGTRKAKDGADRRALLGRLSDFMLRDEPDDLLFGAPAAAEPTVTASPNIEVHLHERAERAPARGGAAEQRESVRFLAFVSRAATRGPWVAEGSFVFADDRFPRIRASPSGDAELVTAGSVKGSDALVWAVRVPGGGVTTLDFALDRWRVAVEEPFTVTVKAYTKTGRFVEVRNGGATTNDAEVSVFHTEDGVTHEVVDVTGATVLAGDVRGRRFKVADVPSKGSRRFLYRLVESSG
jgi:hypothetical protein